MPVETMHRAVSNSWLDRADKSHPCKVRKHGSPLHIGYCQEVLLDKYTLVGLSSDLFESLVQLRRLWSAIQL